MFCDANYLVSGSIVGSTVTGQTVTGTGNVVSTNTIDATQVRDLGQGQQIYLRSTATVAQAGATSVEIQAVGADDAGLTTNVVVLASSGAIPIASLTAGKRFALPLATQIGSLGKRYYGARYVIVGTSTAGAFLTDYGIEVQEVNANYPSGFAVL